MPEDRTLACFYPTSKGVRVELQGVGSGLPPGLFELYLSVVETALRYNKQYVYALKDTSIVIEPQGGVIANPKRFAKVMIKVQVLAERLADPFYTAVENGTVFKTET